MKISFNDEVKWFRESQIEFYDKLKTKTAKIFARKRNENIMHFLGVLEKELTLEDLRR